ncbi:MAG TPA: HEAT repeat domain-containing protein [Longimicrobium sp.]|nr:HEAT repeat domain-containing protein [Longimicrobium sp.]
MTWKWMERLFPAQPEPEPLWMAPEAQLSRSDRLMWMLDDLRSPRWGTLAAERLRDEVGALSPAEWARLDELMRARMEGYSGIHAPAWIRDAADVRRLVLAEETGAAVLGLISTHPSGYVREAAIQRLSLMNGGAELPPLLLRANDWVPQVRARAVDALHARRVEAYAPHWVRSLALVLHLRRCGRQDHRPLVDGVLALLRSPAAREHVRGGLASPEGTVRRACFRILLDAGGPELPALLRDALGGDDAMLRLLAAQAAAGLDEVALAQLLPRMLADSFGRVRLTALQLGAERMGAGVLPALRQGLLDRSPTLRADARAALQWLEPTDLAAFYRAHVIARAAHLPAVIAGVAETGGAEDAALLAPLLDDARPRVRAAALRALVRLTGDAAVPALVRAVGDASPAVSHAAALALRPRVVRAQAAALDAWLGGSHPMHVRRNALGLLALRGKWDAIGWILTTLTDADPELRQAAANHFRRWHARFNRSFSQPGAEQRERIRAALERSGSALPPQDLRWLRFVAGIAS